MAALLSLLAEAATAAVASAAMEPMLEPVRDLAVRSMGGAKKLAQKVHSAHATVPGTGLVTGQLTTGWESLASALQRFERTTLRPVGEDLREFERKNIRPIGEWIAENPCESTKMALYLALGVGNPATALSPCAPQQAASQQARADWIRWGIVGAIGLGIVWAVTR